MSFLFLEVSQISKLPKSVKCISVSHIHKSSDKIGSVIVWEMASVSSMFILAFVLQADAQEKGPRQEGVMAVLGACDTGGQVGKIKTFLRRKSTLSILSSLKQADQQIWVTEIDVFVHLMLILRTSAPGPLLWHHHKALWPLVKQLSGVITFTVTRGRPRTQKIAALLPRGHLSKAKRHPSAGMRMCSGTSLSAVLTAKAKLLCGPWRQGGDATGCLGSTLPKLTYAAPASPGSFPGERGQWYRMNVTQGAKKDEFSEYCVFNSVILSVFRGVKQYVWDALWL